ncbi:MAG TPA: hypothetical protein PKK43_09325 [Spirochaetota bacterium]|nr:hypothetical protein [Spirochaetota bacterium]
MFTEAAAVQANLTVNVNVGLLHDPDLLIVAYASPDVVQLNPSFVVTMIVGPSVGMETDTDE